MHLVIALIQRARDRQDNVAAGVPDNHCCRVRSRIVGFYPSRFAGIGEDQLNRSAGYSLQCPGAGCYERVIRCSRHVRIDVGIVDARRGCQVGQVEAHFIRASNCWVIPIDFQTLRFLGGRSPQLETVCDTSSGSREYAAATGHAAGC
jgi:hypothetical protein